MAQVEEREHPPPGGAFWLLSREGFVLLALGLLAFALFGLASALVSAQRARHEELGREWSARGERALAAGDAEEALQALRTALVYDREDWRYHFRLAQALRASGRSSEARAYLLGLHESQPGSGPVSLELARLEARSGNARSAVRYYRLAIQGLWEGSPDDERLRARLELADLLLAHGDVNEAQAELIAIRGRLPGDASLHVRVGELFRRASDPARALGQFKAALVREPASPAALLGAGRAAFDLRDWTAAATYLRRAARAQPGNRQAADLLTLVDEVLTNDPLRARLPLAERARRTARAVALADSRLDACLLAAPSPDLTALKQRLSDFGARDARSFPRDPDRIEPAMDLVFAIVRAAARCGTPQGPDLALWLLAGERLRAP